MNWPFSKTKKSETDLQVEKLEAQARLNDAKLKAGEVSEAVIKAVSIRRLYEELRGGCASESEFERRLQDLAQQSGMEYEYLRQEFSFKRGVERLESLDEKQLEKLEKLAHLDKERKRILGYGK